MIAGDFRNCEAIMLDVKRGRCAIRCAMLTGFLAALATAGAWGDERFERFEPRSVGDVLPANLVRSPQYRLAPTVRAFGYLNDFVASSSYGVFEAESDTMLRRLVREIHAISVLQGITLTDAYAKALAKAALSPVRGAVQLVSDPVGTA